jgi:hypothetical protein
LAAGALYGGKRLRSKKFRRRSGNNTGFSY